VVIEPSRTPEIAALLLQAYGLSPRELEIAQMLLAGFSVPHIARLLVLSPYTARDHVKSIFEKIGVKSRQELVAAVYFRHYVPELA
jgi:DNA-binding NarL/FixJ family response regulator